MLERLLSLATKYPIDIISHLFILIPILAGLSRFSFLKWEMRLVTLYFFSDFCMESIALVSMLKGYTTVYLLDIRSSLSIALVAAIYYAALIRVRQKRMVAGVGSLFFIFSISFYSGDMVTPWSQTAFRIYAMGTALTYYNSILSDLNLKKIQYHSMFWFTAGLLFYAGGTIFSMLFNQYLFAADTSDNIFNLYWILIQTLYMLFCLLATVGFWVSKHDKKNYFARDYFKDVRF